MSSLEHMRDVLAQELPPPVAKTASEYVDQALSRLRGTELDSSARLRPDTPHGRLVLQYLEAVLAGKRDEAHRLIVEQARAGRSVTELYEQVLQPAAVRDRPHVASRRDSPLRTSTSPLLPPRRCWAS